MNQEKIVELEKIIKQDEAYNVVVPSFAGKLKDVKQEIMQVEETENLTLVVTKYEQFMERDGCTYRDQVYSDLHWGLKIYAVDKDNTVCNTVAFGKHDVIDIKEEKEHVVEMSYEPIQVLGEKGGCVLFKTSFMSYPVVSYDTNENVEDDKLRISRLHVISATEKYFGEGNDLGLEHLNKEAFFGDLIREGWFNKLHYAAEEFDVLPKFSKEDIDAGYKEAIKDREDICWSHIKLLSDITGTKHPYSSKRIQESYRYELEKNRGLFSGVADCYEVTGEVYAQELTEQENEIAQENLDKVTFNFCHSKDYASLNRVGKFTKALGIKPESKKFFEMMQETLGWADQEDPALRKECYELFQRTTGVSLENYNIE